MFFNKYIKFYDIKWFSTNILSFNVGQYDLINHRVSILEGPSAINSRLCGWCLRVVSA